MTWQMLVIGGWRVAGALPVLRWPLAGALIAIAVDFSDLFLMDWLGGIPDYQSFDKACDLAYMFTFLVVALRWSGLERGVAVFLFFFRMVGDALFELTQARPILFVFPNVFEFWFVFVAALHHFAPRATLTARAAASWLVLLLVAKEGQEYFLHIDRTLDNYVATDVVMSWWRALTGGAR